MKVIFDGCQSDRQLGLTLADVLNEGCTNTLVTMFGADEERIEEDFKEVDTDKDGIVTKHEILNAFDRASQLRSPPPPCPSMICD